MESRPKSGQGIVGAMSVAALKCLFACVVLALSVSGCGREQQEPRSLTAPQELPARKYPLPPLVHALPGSVEVRFHANNVLRIFAPLPKGRGMERLKLSPEEMAVLIGLRLAQVRRVLPQLEIREGDKVRVLTDADLRSRLGKPPRSARAAAAFAGIEQEMILTFPPDRHPDAICRVLAAFPAVERCRPRYAGSVQVPVIPNDPQFPNQWGLNNPAVAGPDQAPNFDIDAPEAWELQKGNASIVVAVIDTGVDIRHRDIYEKIWINVNELPPSFVSQANALSSDAWPNILTFTDLNGSSPEMAALRASYGLTDANGNGYIDGEDLYNAFANGVDDDPPATAGEIDDIVGWNFSENTPLPNITLSHGTSVAGLVGATTNNGAEIAGVGWNTRVLAIQGDWSWPSVAYAIKHGAAVITSSLAPAGTSSQLRAVLSSLEDEGIPFSTSLGNVDRYIDGTVYAESPYTIAISNFMSQGIRATPNSSSFSVNTDVASPGQGTYSLALPTGAGGFGGTSSANPIVAGILSLMRAERSDLRPEQLRQVLRTSAVDVPAVTGDRGENTPGFDYFAGWGLANAKNALEQIHTDPWAEAKLTTQPVTYRAQNRSFEVFNVIGSTSEVRAFAGVPGGGTSNVVLEHAAGAPPVAGGAWSIVYSGNPSYLKDQALTTLNRAGLANGLNTIRLKVTAGGREFADFGRVDVPRAYMDLADNTVIQSDFSIRGFAFHPAFARYELQVALGHGVDENDPTLWTPVATPGTATTIAKPPVASGDEFLDSVLFNTVPLGALPDGPATFRLAVFDAGNARVASHSVPVIIDSTFFPMQPGFPVAVQLSYRYGGPTSYDITGDGRPELIFTDQAYVYAKRADGTNVPGWPVAISGGEFIASSPAVGDVTGDGLPEIVVRGSRLDTYQDTLYVFSRDGQPVAPWPIQPPTRNPRPTYPNIDLAPVLADLDGDGDLEILLAGEPTMGGDAKVLAFQANGGLWQSYGPTGAQRIRLAPLVGDLDGDGQLDVVVVSENPAGFLSVWRADGTEITPTGGVWARLNSVESAVLADLNGDGDLEIVLLSFNGHLHAYHHDGTPVSGWEDVQVPGGTYLKSYGLSAADLDPGDGIDVPSIVVAVYDSSTDPIRHGLRVVRPDGTVSPAWTGFFADWSSIQQPTLFDADNDGNMEVLIAPYDVPSDQPFVEVRAFNHDATPVADNRFPIYLQGELTRAPVIADLDGDGDLEYAAVPNKSGSPAVAFDLDARNDPGAVAWGMGLHDPQRSSNYHGGVRILEPTRVRPAGVGPPNDPGSRETLLVRVRNEMPFGSIAVSQVSVRIGGAAATVANLTRVEGEDWILVTTPDQGASGLYTLEVVWNDGGIRRVARQKDAVQYDAPIPPTDQVLVVDTSGSMLSSEKYLAARTAANFYVSARGPQDQAGLVVFWTQASDVLPGLLALGPDGSANRGTLASAIGSTRSPFGATSIGRGLKTALESVLPPFQPGRNRTLVLLSDGLENTAPFWDMGANPVRELFERPENSDVVIHTIALGPDADRDLHAAIADATGGTARFVYLGNSLSLYARLADAYKQVEDVVARQQRLFTRGDDLRRSEATTYNVVVPPGVGRISFAISYRDPGAVVDLAVRGPDGSPVAMAGMVRGPSSRVLALTAPAPGKYSITLTPTKADTEALTTVSITQPDRLFGALAAVTPFGKDKMEGTLVAGVMRHDQARPRLDRKTEVMARVVAPDKSVLDIPLRDDGRSRDGAADDGVFAAPVQFALGGEYAITFVATRGAESIEKTIGYFQARARDNDLDGIPDAWERAHFPGYPIAAVNPLQDHDRDGLNTLEEYRYGTNPHVYDTDGDGRPDGKEVDEGTNPLVADARVPQPGDADADGIPDAWERKYFPGMNPADVNASADPDGDGLSNYTEYRFGTHPRRRDTNGNGISDGEENSWQPALPKLRTWHPQPGHKSERSQTGTVLGLLVLLILLIVMALVLLRLRRTRTAS